MQIALVTADPPLFENVPERSGIPLIAGRSILHHQIELALAAGCERIICIAERQPPGYEQLRQVCTQAGAHLRLLHRPQELSALVSASDRMLVIARNVLAERELMPRTGEGRMAISTLPADPAVAMGFERIDASRAWAGVMLVPGRLVEELHQLPGDIDPASALLRIALMTGIPMTELPINALSRHAISLPRDAVEVRRIESDRISRLAGPVGFAAPARAVVERLAVRAAPRLLATSYGIAGLTAAAGAMFLLAVLVGQAGSTGLALIAAIIGFAGSMALTIVRRIADGAGYRQRSERLAFTVMALGDLALISVLVAAIGTSALALTAWFAPLMLLGLLRLAQDRLPVRYAVTASDRILLAGILLLAHVVGVLASAVMILSVVILAALYVYETRLTEIKTD